MKNTLLCSLLLTATSIAYAQPTAKDIEKLSWLEGSWQRTNAKPGRSGVEQWKKISATEWIGKGINLRGVDTIFVEKLKIVAKDNALFYVADVPQNKTEVYFRFTALTERGFICENPEHDFPKKMEYEYNGSVLKAIISGNGQAMEFIFKK